jgi:hypothetical protein
MRRVSVLVALLAITALMFTSCGKYEEGPAFSLKSKTARLTGEWKLIEMTSNGEVQNMEGIEVLYEFIKDGTMKVTTKWMGMSFSFDGEWRFDDSKENIEIRVKEDNEWSEWEKAAILKLANTELWLKDEYTEEGTTYVDIMKFEKQ